MEETKELHRKQNGPYEKKNAQIYGSETTLRKWVRTNLNLQHVKRFYPIRKPDTGDVQHGRGTDPNNSIN